MFPRACRESDHDDFLTLAYIKQSSLTHKACSLTAMWGERKSSIKISVPPISLIKTIKIRLVSSPGLRPNTKGDFLHDSADPNRRCTCDVGNDPRAFRLQFWSFNVHAKCQQLWQKTAFDALFYRGMVQLHVTTCVDRKAESFLHILVQKQSRITYAAT